jgi:outer membrane protein OmpA-like peptidoglycan-associated protein
MGLVAVSACSDGGGSDISAPSIDDGASKTDTDLPATDPSEPVLPSANEQSSDTVVVTTTATTATSTTQPPTTTTTIPPPVIPSDVLFDSGSSELKPEATPYLEDLADEIRDRHPNASLAFIGHTDSRGSEAANQQLSEERALSVMNWFIGYGFDSSRLSAQGAGEANALEPDVDGDGNFIPEAGSRNRRVEIQIQETD